jgi:hypothetical protein
LGLLQLLDPGRYVNRSDDRKCQASLLTPGEELAARPGIGPAGVQITDVGGEELDVLPPGCLSAGTRCTAGAPIIFGRGSRVGAVRTGKVAPSLMIRCASPGDVPAVFPAALADIEN